MRDNKVKYADVFSDGEPTKMMDHLTGGREAAIQPTFLIFKINSRSYPIRKLSDSTLGVKYRLSPKRWMESKIGVGALQRDVPFTSIQVSEREFRLRKILQVTSKLMKLRIFSTQLALFFEECLSMLQTTSSLQTPISFRR